MTEHFFNRFRATLPSIDALHDGIIGKDAVIEGPAGPRKMIYADYVASGRAHEAVEGWVMREILPFYANSHTEASHCGGVMTRLRREARAEILRICGGDEATHAAVFSGSGATAGLNRLVNLLAVGSGMRVLVGPYEHHSNLLPWRESGAEITTLPEAPSGGVDRDALARALEQARAAGQRVVVSLSAASNVTGITADVAAITAQVKAAGAAMIWDYAGGAPYLPMDLGAGMDAVVLSPHKFPGGPGASGLLLLRRDAVRANRPSLPGGGTVRFVARDFHDYSDSIEAREEGGTPNVVGDLRAALVMVLKDAMGADQIAARNDANWARARARLMAEPRIELLGNLDCPRLPILSFRLRDGQGGYVHQQLATRMLSDHFGVQARGGCACAGPYVMQLLGIEDAEAARLRAAILAGEEIEKPGFVRLNLSWAADEDEITAILNAVCDLAATAPDLAAHYDCDRARAIFRPRNAA